MPTSDLALTARQVSKPLNPGILISRSTRSNFSSRSIPSPDSPLGASASMKPSADRVDLRARRNCGSSSTTRIRLLLIRPAYAQLAVERAKILFHSRVHRQPTHVHGDL